MQASILLGIRKTGFLSAGIFVVLLAVSLRAQTASPAADQPSQPFFLVQSDNRRNWRHGLRKYDGDYAGRLPAHGFEELMFFAGPDLQPTSAMAKFTKKVAGPSFVTRSSETASPTASLSSPANSTKAPSSKPGSKPNFRLCLALTLNPALLSPRSPSFVLVDITKLR